MDLDLTTAVGIARLIAFWLLPGGLLIALLAYIAGRVRVVGPGYIWRNLEEMFCALALFAIVHLTLAQVIFRYFLNSPLVHTNELSLLAMQWGIYIGAAMAYKHGEVLVIDTVVTSLPEPAQRVIFIIVEIVMALIAGALAYAGYIIAHLDANYPLAALPFSQAIFSTAVPVGFALLGLRCLQRIRDLLDRSAPPARRRTPLEL